MKSSVIAALIASAAAVQLKDAPPYFNEPTWRQTWPSAAGLHQSKNAPTPCIANPAAGVTCTPAGQQGLFAVGMNGDEDLGQNITMKGQKFSYGQHEATCPTCGNQACTCEAGKTCSCGAGGACQCNAQKEKVCPGCGNSVCTC